MQCMCVVIRESAELTDTLRPKCQDKTSPLNCSFPYMSNPLLAMISIASKSAWMIVISLHFLWRGFHHRLILLWKCANAVLITTITRVVSYCARSLVLCSGHQRLQCWRKVVSKVHHTWGSVMVQCVKLHSNDRTAAAWCIETLLPHTMSNWCSSGGISVYYEQGCESHVKLSLMGGHMAVGKLVAPWGAHVVFLLVLRWIYLPLTFFDMKSIMEMMFYCVLFVLDGNHTILVRH